MQPLLTPSGVGLLLAMLATAAAATTAAATAPASVQCSLTAKGKGYSTNLDGHHGPMKFASSVQVKPFARLSL